MQINRLFEITYILLNKKFITAKKLAGRFGVSTRTIYRDIDTLSLAGIPVYTEKGKGGGISLLPDFILSKSMLSEAEQQEILTALQSFSSINVADTKQILNKLSAVFNRNTVKWLDADFSEWGSAGEEFNGFKTAILEQHIINFDYYSTNGEKTHRKIEPVQLLFKSKSWYVKGFCLAKQDIRLFKLSRVRNVTVTNEPFTERVYPDNNHDSNLSNLKNPYVNLKLKIAPKMTYRIYDDFIEKWAERQPDGSFIVSVAWPEDDWLYGMILSYGEYIEVLEPEHIKEIIKKKSEKILNKYL